MPVARPETVLTHARLVLPGGVMSGALRIAADGTIAEIADAPASTGEDLDGDLLLPGIVDLHTDNLERQVQPRETARWPSRSALVAHDAQCAAAGVTTVFDALCFGDLGFSESRAQTTRDGIADLDALGATGLLKAEHFLHLRCEVPAPEMPSLVAPVAGHPRARIASLMDHTPGIGQYADLDRYRAMRRRDGLPAPEIEHRIAVLNARRLAIRRDNRAALLAMLAERPGGPIAIASHDDGTEDEVAENAADGIAVSEFPTTLAAARAARTRGMAVIAGAPNLVRGGSHSGNVAVADLLRAEAVDALASDYVPGSLLEAAFLHAASGAALPRAVALVTAAPARMVGLSDRGRIEAGLRADLIRVRVHEGLPVVRQVWRAGERVI